MASTQKQKTAFAGSVAGLLSAPLSGYLPGVGFPKTYEVLPNSEEAWIYVAMIRIMLGCLAQTKT